VSGLWVNVIDYLPYSIVKATEPNFRNRCYYRTKLIVSSHPTDSRLPTPDSRVTKTPIYSAISGRVMGEKSVQHREVKEHKKEAREMYLLG
jgi:hypothetical protein